MRDNGATAPPEAPERGAIILCLPQGEDPDPMLLEMEELLRTAGVETVATVVQHRVFAAPRQLPRAPASWTS